MNEFSRTELLLGTPAMERLKNAHVAVFGIGGVGSFTTEALARSGIGHLDLFDNDVVSLTNINRQIIADHATIDQPKVEVMQQRIARINPHAEVQAHQIFYTIDTADTYDFRQYDYIVDAIDTVTSKLLLIERAKAAGTPIISSMGTGNKLDPTRFQIADISKTSVCPLARVMRRELKQRGIKNVKVLFSTEEPCTPQLPESGEAESLPQGRRQIPGSIAFVPPVAGMILAGEVIRDLIKIS